MSRPAGSWCRVLVIEHAAGGLSGAENYLLRLAPLMARRGVEQILASPPGSVLARAWRDGGGTHVPHDVFGGLLRSPEHDRAALRVAGEAGRTLYTAWRTARLARRIAVDVLQANCHGLAHAEVVLAGKLIGRPTVLHLHEETPAGLRGRVRGVAVRGADVTIGVSAAVGASLPGPAASKCQVIHSGVDVDVFTPGPPDAALRAQLSDRFGAPVVLVVSRLVPGKGIEDVIAAVAGLPSELGDVRLVFAGAFFQPGYEQRVRRLGENLLGDRVRFLGRRGDIPALLRTADVVVHASASEGLGLSVLEAQACARPVVCYPAGGVADLVCHGRTGLLARQGDVADLSAAIARVLGDPGFGGALGAAARARVEQSNSLEHQADAHTAILAELLGRPALREPAWV